MVHLYNLSFILKIPLYFLYRSVFLICVSVVHDPTLLIMELILCLVNLFHLIGCLL